MKKILFFIAGILLFLSCSTRKADSVFAPGTIRQTMNKVAEWQIKNPRHAPNDWTNGAFYAGLFAAWETTKSQTIYDAMMAMGNDSTQWRPYKRWYHADDIAICQTYIDLYRIEKHQEMIQPTIDTLAILFENPYPYKGIQVIKWWWCDALFMAPPVLAKLGTTLNDQTYYQYNDQYFKE